MSAPIPIRLALQLVSRPLQALLDSNTQEPVSFFSDATLAILIALFDADGELADPMQFYSAELQIIDGQIITVSASTTEFEFTTNADWLRGTGRHFQFDITSEDLADLVLAATDPYKDFVLRIRGTRDNVSTVLCRGRVRVHNGGTAGNDLIITTETGEQIANETGQSITQG